MVHGIDIEKTKEEKKKSMIERDIELYKDITEAYCQGGKAIGEIVRPKGKKSKKRKK